MAELTLDALDFDLEQIEADPSQVAHQKRAKDSKEPWFAGMVPNRSDRRGEMRDRFVEVKVGDFLEATYPYCRSCEVLEVKGNAAKVKSWAVTSGDRREWQELWRVCDQEYESLHDATKKYKEIHCIVEQESRAATSSRQSSELTGSIVKAVHVTKAEIAEAEAAPVVEPVVKKDGKMKRGDMMKSLSAEGVKEIHGKKLIKCTADEMHQFIKARELDALSETVEVTPNEAG